MKYNNHYIVKLTKTYVLTVSQWRAVEQRKREIAIARAEIKQGLRKDSKEKMRSEIRYNWQSLWEIKDNNLSVRENNRRLNLNPIYGEKSPDPVYRKLTRIISYIKRLGYINQYAGLEGSLRERANRLQTDIENRTINEEDYDYLLKTPRKAILDAWSRSK